MYASSPPSISRLERRFTAPTGERSLRIYRPETEVSSLPVVLYLHGGGFVGGCLDDVEGICHFLANRCNALVIAAEYALAPAHPFPAAPEDAYAAILWISRHAASLGGDARRLAVAGDDAGGNLAASLTLMARDRGTPDVAAQVLIAPLLDPSMTRLGNGEQLNSDIDASTCANYYRQYLPMPRQRLHPYAAPLISTRRTGLPPALILTAGCDVLHREAEMYAEALIGAGVPTQVVRYPLVTHAALSSHVPAREEIVHFLRRRLREMPADSRMNT
ncbi:alpha/beta hydrolase [Uliginosibacterium gangwonense]|uniref:alpha/beta hydrolase n=1 Tax=Uliginosibacterium gangwonense TaxID=392736 RepID=UPI0003730793|nr:alpha/beta hydrolase [Uliginosibacterium gangwonense]